MLSSMVAPGKPETATTIKRASPLNGGTPPVPDTPKGLMSIIGWLILGLIAGFIANKLVNKVSESLILGILLGVVAAVVGGFLFSVFGAAPVTGLNIYSMIVALIGAIVVLVIYHAVVDRRGDGRRDSLINPHLGNDIR